MFTNKKTNFKYFLFQNVMLFIFILVLATSFLMISSERNNDNEMDAIHKNDNEKEYYEDCHPPVTSNEDFVGEKTHFKFSPNKEYITFVQNVFEEYENDWDRYWAVKLFNRKNKTEKFLFVDNTRMSSYEWLNDNTIRIFHNAGIGIRTYVDVSIFVEKTIFSKDFKDDVSFWKIDIDYVQELKDYDEARRIYHFVSPEIFEN
ncbi:MAG: hypothetical protein ABIG87_01075 [Patescibacteria group bacterium]